MNTPSGYPLIVRASRPFCTSDNIQLAGLDAMPGTPADALGAAVDPRPALARVQSLTPPQPKPAAPTWWRLTLTLHQGATVIRNLTERPDAKEVLVSGWYEREANGDEFAVGYDSVATVRVQGFSGPMTGVCS